MRQVIICQFAMCQHSVDMRQTGLWTIAHGNCHGTIKRLLAKGEFYQLVVKRKSAASQSQRPIPPPHERLQSQPAVRGAEKRWEFRAF